MLYICRPARRKKRKNYIFFFFRFFSSTDFYPTPEQISGSFVELNTENWENLESALEERLRIVVENAIKESTRNKTYFSTYMKSEGIYPKLSQMKKSSMYVYKNRKISSP